MLRARYPPISVAVLSGHRARPARGEQHPGSAVLGRHPALGRPSASELAEPNFRVGHDTIITSLLWRPSWLSCSATLPDGPIFKSIYSGCETEGSRLR